MLFAMYDGSDSIIIHWASRSSERFNDDGVG